MKQFRYFFLFFISICLGINERAKAENPDEPADLPLRLTMHSTDYLTQKVIPHLLPRIGRELGVDVFNIEIPDVPPQVVFNQTYTVRMPMKVTCGVAVRVRANNMFASVGVGEDDIQLARVNNQTAIVSLDLHAISKARIVVELIGGHACGFIDSAALVEVEVEDIHGHAEVQASISEDGRLILQPVDQGNDLNFEIRPEELDINIRESAGLASGLIELFEQVQILTGGAINIMGRTSLDGILETIATDFLLSDSAQRPLRDALFTALEQGLSEPISFEFEEDLDQELEAEGETIQMHAQVSAQMDLEDVRFVGENGVDTTWSLNIETGEGHECANDFVYQPTDVSLRLPRIPEDLAEEVDASVSIPRAILGKAIFEAGKQGAFCSVPQMLPIQCEVPDDIPTNEECIENPLIGRFCGEVPDVRNGFEFELDGPIVSLNPSGKMRLFANQDSPNVLRLFLPMKASLAGSGTDVSVDFNLRAGLVFSVSSQGEVSFALVSRPKSFDPINLSFFP